MIARILLWCLLLVAPALADGPTAGPFQGGAVANPTQFMSGTTSTSFLNPWQQPCTIFRACAAGVSVTTRLNPLYSGPLSLLYRDDGATFSSTTYGSTGLVDAIALHAFADGHNTFFECVYDQYNLAGSPCNTVAGTMPLLGWDLAGLPVVVLPVQGLNNAGGSLISPARPDLPYGGASITLAEETDNANWSSCCGETFSLAATAPNDLGGFGVMASQTNPNTQTCMWGVNWEGSYSLSAYPCGYAKLAGAITYNSATGLVTTAVLPSTCVPNGTTSCNVFTKGNIAPGFTVNRGLGLYPQYLRIGEGTDSGKYGGRFQTGIIDAEAATPTQVNQVLKSLAEVHLPKSPSPCAAQSSNPATAPVTLTAAQPNSTYPTTVQNYNGTATLNQTNLVALWATWLINPDFTTNILDVQRADTGAPSGIGPSGCDLDAGAVSVANGGSTSYTGYIVGTALTTISGAPAINQQVVCTTCALNTQIVSGSGTTWTVSQSQTVGSSGSPVAMTGSMTLLGQRVFDQSGHNFRMYAPSALVRPVLLPTAMNGKACLWFTNIAPISFTGVSTTPGILTVTSPSGTMLPGMVLTATGMPSGAQTLGTQLTGTTGGAGNYNWSVPNTVTSQTMYGDASTRLVIDPSIWYQPTGGSNAGLYQNQTVMVAYQTAATGLNTDGAIVSMGSGWALGGRSNLLQLGYYYNAGPSYAVYQAATFSPNQAHFGVLTADGSTPQNLSIAVDGTTPTTGTTTAYALLSGGIGNYYQIGGWLAGYGFTGCVSMVAIFNDVEPAGNIAAMRAVVQNEMASP